MMNLVELVDFAKQQADPYLCLALHPFVGEDERIDLEALMLTGQREKRCFAAASYAPASVLRVLATEPDEKIRVRLAKNPATPADTLVVLMSDSADPNEKLLVAIAGHRHAPTALLDGLHSDAKKVRRALCANPNVSLQSLRRLVVDASLAELKAIGKNPGADGPLLNELWNQHEAYLCAEIAAHPDCPASIIQQALDNDCDLIRRKLAENTRLNPQVLLQLLEDESGQVRAAAARNGLVPVEGRGTLEDDPSRQVRRVEARQTEVPVTVLTRLAQDEDVWVRRWLARNPSVPADLLAALSDDPAMEVQRAVGRNRNCPLPLMEKLAKHPHPWVRAGIAFRQDTPVALLAEFAKEENEDILSGVGQNPNSPEALLAPLVEHPNKDIRRSVILNKMAPPKLLGLLTTDPYPLNRAILAGHRRLDEADRRSLLQDPEPQVRYTAARMLAMDAVKAAQA